MALSCRFGKRQHIAVWKIETKRNCETEAFRLHGCEWRFSLDIQFNNQYGEEHWTLQLHRVHPPEGANNFIITVYVPDKHGKLECMCCGRYLFPKTSSNIIMWRRTPQVTIQYPDIVFDNGISFVISFLADDLKIDDLERVTVNRSIQTPHYLDIHPCLDTLRSNFGKMLEDGLYTDVELHCGKRTLRAHKAVLIARSEVFAAMLQNDMLEKQKGSIEFIDMSYPVLKEFLEYLYTGSLPELTIDNAAGLYEAGDKYAIETLKSRCAHFLKEHIGEGNACMLLALADTHSDEDLKDFVMSYITRKDMLVQIEQQLGDEYPNLNLDKMRKPNKPTLPAAKVC